MEGTNNEMANRGGGTGSQHHKRNRSQSRNKNNGGRGGRGGGRGGAAGGRGSGGGTRGRGGRGGRGGNGRGGGSNGRGGGGNNNGGAGVGGRGGRGNSVEPPKKRNRRNNNNNNRNGGGGDGTNDGKVAVDATTANNMSDGEIVDMVVDAPKQESSVSAGGGTTRGGSASGAGTDPSFMTQYKFIDQPSNVIDPLTLKAITKEMKLERLTEIQYKTLQATTTPGGGTDLDVDVLGRARTGTGKTVAFLIPAIQTVLKKKSRTSSSSSNSKSIEILIISPTRELATQIMNQAKAILTFQNRKQFTVQLIIGGTNMRSDVSKFSNNLPTILVATPGRLKDHLQNTVLKNGTKFANCFDSLKVSVLDEADQLLEMGFRQDIFTILKFLPSVEQRQTLLFSATMPHALKEVMAKAMKRQYVTVDCIHDNDANGSDNNGNGNNKETNSHVIQTHVILPPGMDRLVLSVIEVVLLAMKQEPDYKIIAFFPTARLVGYFAELVNLGIRRGNTQRNNGKPFPEPIIEIHSRKSQANRNKASDKFRNAKSSILFTSDVSARGVDYPGVTTVIQFGLPDSREQYIHRLGRTGRAGKAGRGWLVLADYERTFLNELQKGGNSGGVNVPVNKELQTLFSSPPTQDVLDLVDPVLTNQIGKCQNQELVKSAQQAYQAWLGFYKDRIKRMTKPYKTKVEIVQMANEFAKLMGLTTQPALLKKTIGKMGLKGVPGIKVTNQL